MEGFRMLDEWPLIRAKINNYDLVFRIVRALEDEETEAEALERILDDAFNEFVDETPGGVPVKKGQTGAVGNLGRSERRMLSLVDGKRSVHRLIDLSRLVEFEACKALVTLLDEGFISPVKRKRARESPGRRGRLNIVGVLTKFVVNIVVLGGLAAAAFLMPWSRIELRQNSEQVTLEAWERVRANRLVAISQALEVYRVETGHYPDDLSALLKAGLLDTGVLDLPGAHPPRYVSIGADYDLR